MFSSLRTRRLGRAFALGALATASLAMNTAHAAACPPSESADATSSCASSPDASALPAAPGPLPAAPTGFRDCPDCPEMVPLPAGDFQMGSPSEETGRKENEGPVHRVVLPSFAIGRTKITRAQFAEFVAASAYKTADHCYTFEDGAWNDRRNRDWRNPGFAQDDTHPAVCISWLDAKAYAIWLSHKTGQTYRLPTEAEWEYAVRAGTSGPRYWGEATEQACAFANILDQTAADKLVDIGNIEVHRCADGYPFTAPAMRFAPNRFGLHDMIGNAWEWVEDCGGGDNYTRAPTDGRAATLGSCHFRVLRGASWLSPPRETRSAARSTGVALLRSSGTGFRLARPVP